VSGYSAGAEPPEPPAGWRPHGNDETLSIAILALHMLAGYCWHFV